MYPVRPEQITSDAFGHAEQHADGFWCYVPASLPRHIELESETLLALSEADAALGRLSGVGGMLKEPRLLMRPYAVREALASARIEGTQASLTEVFEADAGHPPRPLASEVTEITAHVNALEMGIAEDTSGFDVGTLRSLHRDLMAGAYRRALAGKIRTGPVWLGSPTDHPETAEFVPPVGQSMTAAMEDWERFIREPPRLPVLIRAALLHYQFLTIHPFYDGNGRVGRMFVLLYLYRQGRISAPLLYLSPYFERRRREYYDRLQSVRERGEIQQWLQFFLTAVAAQADDGVHRARELLDLRERYRSALRGSRSRASEVVETLFMNPIVTTARIKKKLGITSQGALNLIRGLEAKGWLEDAGVSGRGGAASWLASDVYRIIASEEHGSTDETAPAGSFR